MSEIILNDSGTISSENFLLPLPTDKQCANFELGVTMAIYNWHTLTTAVDNLWGGPQSAEKRDWISGLVIEAFESNKTIDIIYIHEILSGAMEDEFDTILEDDSTIQVAAKIVKYYRECLELNFDNIKAAFSKWEEKQRNRKKIVAEVNEDPLNPDVSDDDEIDEDEDMDVDIDYEVREIIPQEKKQPEIDDDGFTIVSSKRR
ncbi:hypothetical protein CANINC_003049 [Pichia inconspicua]|uniref:Pre-rRNA-processing protein TSR2 n=1 Tax=Pichia inconspicua TaxID=52247 RepID=A0A4T0X008_9ASCO|nr:hypothetical protein CANINC_003049 [[Candida] inconspicua]